VDCKQSLLKAASINSPKVSYSALSSNVKKINSVPAVIVGTKRSSDRGSIIENDVSILSKKQKKLLKKEQKIIQKIEKKLAKKNKRESDFSINSIY
jgi:hypothetical protein